MSWLNGGCCLSREHGYSVRASFHVPGNAHESLPIVDPWTWLGLGALPHGVLYVWPLNSPVVQPDHCFPVQARLVCMQPIVR